MNRKRLVVYFVSFVLLIISIIVIYLLWNVGKNRVKCDLDGLTGEIIKYPKYNDNDVLINKTKEYYDENEEAIIVTIYEYKDYIITYNNDLNSKGLSYLTIKNKNNEALYSNQYLVLKINGVECTNNGNYVDKDVMNIEPVVFGGKLYFVSLSSSCYLHNGSNVPYYDYNYIDLSNSYMNVERIEQMKLKSDYNYNDLCY